MKLGMVTYMWGAEWDLPTLLKNCVESGFQGVELRTTHKHGVEPALSEMERNNVRSRFADSGIELVGLGSACDYHSEDPAQLKKQIELTKQFTILSHDCGGTGVKVRPNSLVKGKDRAASVAQIGAALAECGEFAEGYGQEIRLEVHGKPTSDLTIIKEIMEAAGRSNVVVCWNSNPGEVENGSIRKNFELVKSHLGRTVHIHDLFDRSYPYKELFALLRGIDYHGYCLSDSPATTDPVRVMRYYRAL
ncbi:MAG: sugar phosphate isomerase/epimerase family protein, partial [Planctomycetaceae bacterium]